MVPASINGSVRRCGAASLLCVRTLTLAERVTRIADEHTSAAPGVDVEGALSKQQIAAVTWLAIEMNGWNRIAIASHYPVGP